MKYKIRIILLGMVLVAAVTPAHAFTVDLDGTNATGINNLDIGGAAYDVTFDFVQADTAASCGAAPCDVFFGDQTGAEAAVDAINTALSSTAAITVGSAIKMDYFVPYAIAATDVNAWQGTNLETGFWIKSTNAALDTTDIIEFARFSPAVVPIPPAAWLFGSALAILGWVRRRTGAAAA
jgi:hypothetical protein